MTGQNPPILSPAAVTKIVDVAMIYFDDGALWTAAARLEEAAREIRKCAQAKDDALGPLLKREAAQ
ncbi:hypothetical protein C4N9_20605 [Pararhodobacter marinus]|uniref:Uncharacterized protein n=1 Tax=Pararhodobacter marinus TaxID=2184063 RepID=A0A2U2C476_9RHOB|nr:hypothetical protein [Pararhodobacter marinus]PWE26667.1 hypothetical protein C4N9_20605 [Pararhodobacter marinus]